jgi:acyl-CoA reductase-like NAD-dependent aldehyde dehydrogenase
MSTAAAKPLPAHPANVLIGGSWQPGSGTEAIEVVNPATAGLGSGFYSDAPFGGYKRSGYGRTGGPEGYAELLQTKAILS